MNKFQRAAIRTFAKGAYRDIAAIDDAAEAAEAIERTGDFMFQDVVDALRNVVSNEEAVQALRRTISRDQELIAPAM